MIGNKNQIASVAQLGPAKQTIDSSLSVFFFFFFLSIFLSCSQSERKKGRGKAQEHKKSAS